MKLQPIFLLCLIVTCCAPARLERLKTGSRIRSIAAPDLSRALEGAQDEAAKRSLGNWIAANFKNPQPHSPAGYRIRFSNQGPGVFGPEYFDRLEPVSHYKTIGLTHHRIDGTGIALLGIRENHQLEPVEKYYPPEAITRAVTAVAIAGPVKHGIKQVEVRLIDRMHTETFNRNGATLAADFTVPFAALLERTSSLQSTGLTSLLRARSDREPGFVLMEPYDSQRTPLIFIHGLLSTPLAWAELSNEVWAVPAIRQRYQIWHYLYPTNPPALYSARIMRGQLDELRHFLDPDGKDPAMKRTVIVSHSMGGLLAKTLAVGPRDAFWDAVFTRPLESLNVTRAERATLEEAFFWKPRGNVDRIVFCSVPFRGSKIASSWFGRIADLFIAPSPGFHDFFKEVERKNPGMLQPDYVQMTRQKISSVSTLSPHQRSMEILDELPVTDGTASHIITGSLDFVVHRSSATVAGAESNLEVPAGHGSFHHPDAIAEIIRILELPAAR